MIQWKAIRHVAMTIGAVVAGSAILTTHLDNDFSGPQFLVPNVIRAIGQALVLTIAIVETALQ